MSNHDNQALMIDAHLKAPWISRDHSLLINFFNYLVFCKFHWHYTRIVAMREMTARVSAHISIIFWLSKTVLKVHSQGFLREYNIWQKWTQHSLMLLCINFQFCKPIWFCALRWSDFVVWRWLLKTWWCRQIYNPILPLKHAFKQNLFVFGCSCTARECVVRKKWFRFVSKSLERTPKI